MEENGIRGDGMTRKKILELARQGVITPPDKVSDGRTGVHCIFDEDLLRIELEAVKVLRMSGMTYKQIAADRKGFAVMCEVIRNNASG